MNKRRLQFDIWSVSRGAMPSFLFCAGSFIPGVLIGAAMAGPFSSGSAAADCLSSFAGFLSSGAGRGEVLPIFLRLSLYPLVSFLLGFCVFGVVLIPALSLLRGFTLAFTLAVLTRLGCAEGAIAGYIVLGIPALFTVPLFLLVSSGALRASCRLSRLAFLEEGGQPGIYGAACFLRFFAAGILLLLISLGECAILGLAAPKLPIP